MRITYARARVCMCGCVSCSWFRHTSPCVRSSTCHVCVWSRVNSRLRRSQRCSGHIQPVRWYVPCQYKTATAFVHTHRTVISSRLSVCIVTVLYGLCVCHMYVQRLQPVLAGSSVRRRHLRSEQRRPRRLRPPSSARPQPPRPPPGRSAVLVALAWLGAALAPSPRQLLPLLLLVSVKAYTHAHTHTHTHTVAHLTLWYLKVLRNCLWHAALSVQP